MNGDNNGYPRDLQQQVTLLIERQRNTMKRLEEIEKKQNEVSSLMNKGMGGMSVVMMVGVFVGWLFAVGGNVLKWFRP